MHDDDVMDRLFAALEDLGEDVMIRYGQVSDDEVRWHGRSHVRHDGIGGLIHVVRALGGDLRAETGEISDAARSPSDPRLIWRLARMWSAPGASWRRFPDGRAPELRVHGRRPAVAWKVLDAERTAGLRARAQAEGASVGGLLLSCLNDALSPHLDTAEGPAQWVVPVNLRGAVVRRRRLANHLSSVPVRIAQDDEPRRVTRRVHALLADGGHWAVLSAVRAALAVDGVVGSTDALAERLAGRSVGMFSNFGAWSTRGLDARTRWVAGAPAVRFLPLAASIVTVDGSLGMMLIAYPGLTLRDAEVAGWLDAWVEQTDRQLERVPSVIRRRSARVVRAT
jgi:hypothetical protein